MITATNVDQENKNHLYSCKEHRVLKTSFNKVALFKTTVNKTFDNIDVIIKESSINISFIPSLVHNNNKTDLF